LRAWRELARLIPERVFLVAIVPAFAAAGVTFFPLGFIAAGGTDYRAVLVFNPDA
jgi:hypothetical protein